MNVEEEQLELLRDIDKWLRFMGFKQVKDVLTTTLDDPKKAHTYHLSDGKNTSTIISKATGINQPRITELWKEWLSLGLGEPVSASGGSRFKHSFDLKMFNITLPEIKQKSTKSKENSDSIHEENNHEQ